MPVEKEFKRSFWRFDGFRAKCDKLNIAGPLDMGLNQQYGRFKVKNLFLGN
jgi:hypothetical protein